MDPVTTQLPAQPADPLVMHPLPLCTALDHDLVRTEAAVLIAPHPPDRVAPSPRTVGWMATRRPWLGAGLLVGECPICHSTLAIDDPENPVEDDE